MDKLRDFRHLRIVKLKVPSWFFVLVVTACIDPYPLEVIPTGEDYLVIDGFINSGEGPTTFKLSHLMNIEDKGEPRPELGAVVAVESSEGEVFELMEKEKGAYSEEHPVDAHQQYRLRIKTADGKEYLSDFVEVKHTPPIDSVTWDLNAEYQELRIYVTTHDPEIKARYYQWEYEETYNFQSAYPTKLEYRDGEIIWDPYLDIHNCWKTIHSTRLLTSTTVRLREDVVNKFHLTYVTPESEKIRLKYSILVKQHALTPEAYSYIEELKKYTELNGSIFDPVPSRITGNIRCLSNPDEPAVGYISCYNVEEKRIFISPQSPLPNWFQGLYRPCPEEEGGLGGGPGGFETGYTAPVGYSPNIFSAHLKTCVDCRAKKGIHKGGTNIKPDFWP